MLLLGAPVHAAELPAALRAQLEQALPSLVTTYQDLHRTPELSFQEEKTAAKLAAKLKTLGYEVTTGVGGHGVVGVLRNGPGRTVALRTDLDALPVEEKTGLAYASTVKAVDDGGVTVPVMHACGHDAHMTCWLGTAELLAKARNLWKGTLVLVGQPAEERGSGAKKMISDGLFTRFPKPDFAIAAHMNAGLPAGEIGYTSGFALANVDSVDITIYGVGGHGAYPHSTVDPIVIAARVVMALQTIVARENNPLDPAVVTVGSIHGGAKHNIIPDEVKLQLTVRSYRAEVRSRMLDSIRRITRMECLAAGAPKEPLVETSEGTPATYNDPQTTRRVATALRAALGDAKVHEIPAVMGGEDFSEFGLAGVPSVLFWVGAVEERRFRESQSGGAALPSLHSPFFAPDAVNAIRTGVLAEAAAVLEVLSNPPPSAR
jgi:hippurate hydrolase